MIPLGLISPYKTLAAVIGAAVIAIGLLWTGHHYGAQGVQAERDKEKRESAEMTLATERETRRAVDTITMNSRKENDRAKATIESLRSDVRNGTERLSIAVESCQAGDTGTGNKQARCELLPTVADRIVGIAGDANETVRNLNECIDKYEAVRNLLKNDKPQ